MGMCEANGFAHPHTFYFLALSPEKWLTNSIRKKNLVLPIGNRFFAGGLSWLQ